MGKVIISDIDGVVANFFDAARRYCSEHFYKELPPDWLENTLTSEELHVLVHDKDLFSELDVYPYVKSSFRQLKNRGYEICLVSKRKLTKDVTLGWLLKNKIPFDKFHTYSDKDRIKLAKIEKPLAFIEDNFATALSVSKFVKYSFLVDHPWNRYPHPDVVRVDTLEDIFFYLEQ